MRARAHTHTHTHKPVCEQDDVTVLCKQGVHKDREVTASRPYIVIINKEGRACILIDMAVPADRNVIQKKAENK